MTIARFMARLFPRWRRYTRTSHTVNECWCGGSGYYDHRGKDQGPA